MLLSLFDHKQCLAGLQVLSGWLMWGATLSEDQLEDSRPPSSNISNNKNGFLSCCCLLRPRDFFFFLFPPNIFFPRSTKLPSKGHLVVLTSTFLIILFFFFKVLFWSVSNQFWIKIYSFLRNMAISAPVGKQDFGLHHIFYGLRGMLMWEVARLWLYWR